jgi:hypothetical protein
VIPIFRRRSSLGEGQRTRAVIDGDFQIEGFLKHRPDRNRLPGGSAHHRIHTLLRVAAHRATPEQSARDIRHHGQHTVELDVEPQQAGEPRVDPQRLRLPAGRRDFERGFDEESVAHQR